MEYKGIIYVKKKDLKYYNKCLKDIENGYVEDFINIGKCDFSNGNSICIDLISGYDNYYLQYVIYDKSGNEIDYDILDFDYNWGLEDTFNIYDTNNNTYIIELKGV